ncbi:MAG: hypothetical protein ACRDYD_04935 [Acidimicrobiales bacterium]
MADGRRAGEGGKTAKGRKGKGIRGTVSRVITKIPFLRRLYIKRLLRFMERSEAKGRRLPPELETLQTRLSRLPKKDRASALETAMLAEQQGPGSREMRRAAGRQQRLSGRGSGRQRPGALHQVERGARRPR